MWGCGGSTGRNLVTFHSTGILKVKITMKTIGSQVRMMEEVGFTEVDVAWRQDGFFVAGGRKCLPEKDK